MNCVWGHTTAPVVGDLAPPSFRDLSEIFQSLFHHISGPGGYLPDRKALNLKLVPLHFISNEAQRLEVGFGLFVIGFVVPPKQVFECLVEHLGEHPAFQNFAKAFFVRSVELQYQLGFHRAHSICNKRRLNPARCSAS